mmetsp:Transcript_45518/g.97582  ORF Transcript_45518/g.97582 Transcript_45518/m.97582 type:complete len:81 (-) Transcript_45518:330-572(-)
MVHRLDTVGMISTSQRQFVAMMYVNPIQRSDRLRVASRETKRCTVRAASEADAESGQMQNAMFIDVKTNLLPILRTVADP